MGLLFLIMVAIFVTVGLVLNRRAGGSGRHRSPSDSGGMEFGQHGDSGNPHRHPTTDGSSHHHGHHHSHHHHDAGSSHHGGFDGGGHHGGGFDGGGGGHH